MIKKYIIIVLLLLGCWADFVISFIMQQSIFIFSLPIQVSMQLESYRVMPWLIIIFFLCTQSIIFNEQCLVYLIVFGMLSWSIRFIYNTLAIKKWILLNALLVLAWAAHYYYRLERVEFFSIYTFFKLFVIIIIMNGLLKYLLKADGVIAASSRGKSGLLMD